MKKIIIMILFLLLINLVSAQDNLYQKNSLEMRLNIAGGFELFKEADGGTAKNLNVELLLYPDNDFRQTILEEESKGKIADDKVTFEWVNGPIGETNFDYSVLIKTNNQQNKVSTRIDFPVAAKDVSGYEQYLRPTDTIDSENAQIVKKATELAEGEDDLFKVVFNLANWVESNVVYELNSLTDRASQKASWVLANKQGVCDEMTSLFVAMARAIGIPARFVSGISYTTSELFTEKWQPHGWAEIYFPKIGWVSFDITFGEYGYIDVTHIKLRDSFDPAEPATKFSWLAKDIRLEPLDLDLKVKVTKEGLNVPEEILLEQEVIAEETGFGSYNLIKGIVKNTADHYAATTLQLAVPKEVEILGRNKRTVLLSPKEVRETFWIVKVSEGLDPSYWYKFPTLIHTEKNISIENIFSVQKGKNVYSQEEIEKLTVKDEEKSYSRKISFDCDYLPEIFLNEAAAMTCTIKNVGNKNLQKVNFCLGNYCQLLDLAVNQQETRKVPLNTNQAGWQKIIVSAENLEVEKKTSLEYSVLDRPMVSANIEYPTMISFHQPPQIKINLDKNSFTVPKQIRIHLTGGGLEHRWEINELKEQQQLTPDFEEIRVSGKNKFKMTITWNGDNQNTYTETKEFIIKGQAQGLGEKIKMLLNRLINLF